MTTLIATPDPDRPEDPIGSIPWLQDSITWLQDFEIRDPGDPAKDCMELVHTDCMASVCDVETGDELWVLLRCAQTHRCGTGPSDRQ